MPLNAANLDVCGRRLWSQLEPLSCHQTLIGHEVELSFVPQIAGDTRMFIWTLTEEGQRRADRAARNSKKEAAAAEASSRGNASKVLGQRRSSQVVRASTPSYDFDRLPLPGAPFVMDTKPGPPSAPHSRIDGLLINIHGNWEESHDPSVLRAGLPRPKTPETDEPQSNIQVGDTVRFRPSVADEFGNAVFAAEGVMAIFVKGQAGPESDEHLHLQIIVDRRGGAPTYDARYEIKRRGRHLLHVTINGKHVSGSPLEWHAIPCRPDGRRWEPGEKEAADAAASGRVEFDD